jgi:epoxide hydrolase-like predicted phosphatase
VAVKAIFFDLGGVIVRTEYQSPRQHLAERLNMEYEQLVRLVFESETSRMASLGKLSMEEHWAAVVKKLGRPASEIQGIRDEFFAGDILDRELIAFIRSLRPKYKTGMISNAWNDMRQYLVKERCDDAFDILVISAEVGVIKPEARIYQLALEQAGVRAAEALLVDDTELNIEGCEKIGMQGILFKDARESIQQVKALI